MQTCLNDDANYFFKQFKKYPWILVIIVLFVASGISIFTVSLLCKVQFPCSDQQQSYSLFFGLNMCLFTAVFIVLPCCLRSTLNCIYEEETVLPVSRRSPLSSNIQRPLPKEKSPSPNRRRSLSRESQV